MKQEPTLSQEDSQVIAHSLYSNVDMIAKVLDFKVHRFVTTLKGDMWLVGASVFVTMISDLLH